MSSRIRLRWGAVLLRPQREVPSWPASRPQVHLHIPGKMNFDGEILRESVTPTWMMQIVDGRWTNCELENEGAFHTAGRGASKIKGWFENEISLRGCIILRSSLVYQTTSFAENWKCLRIFFCVRVRSLSFSIFTQFSLLSLPEVKCQREILTRPYNVLNTDSRCSLSYLKLLGTLSGYELKRKACMFECAL